MVLLSVGRSSFLIFWLVLELVLGLLYLGFISLQLSFAHFVVRNLIGRYESMVVFFLRLDFQL